MSRDPDRSQMLAVDLAGEALAGVLQRPGRTALTMLGTVLGIGAFVAILGLTSTAAGQIDKRFTELAATELSVTDVGGVDPLDMTMSFPASASATVEALKGVRHAGVWWPVSNRPAVTRAPGLAVSDELLPVVAAESAMLAAAHPVLQTGRLFDAFHDRRGERVAVLGSVAASRLGIGSLDGLPAVFIDGTPYSVLGVIEDVQRKPELLLSVIIPSSVAVTVYGPPVEPRAQMLVETDLGATGVVGAQVALAMRPDQPNRFKVLTPPDPQSLRNRVGGDFAVLFLLLAAVTLVIGAVGIANTTLVAVLERVPEIGLRRALGARSHHIAGQFLAESGLLGGVGGLVGGSVGVLVVLTTALVKDWTAILTPWTVLVAPVLGITVGLAAGAYPALRAARVEPVEALRR